MSNLIYLTFSIVEMKTEHPGAAAATEWAIAQSLSGMLKDSDEDEPFTDHDCEVV